MVVWCALATAVLVASTQAFTPPSLFGRTIPRSRAVACPSVARLAFGLSGAARRITSPQPRHMQQGLWARRRSGVTARLSPAETGVPDVAERPDVAAIDHAGRGTDGGSSPSSKKLSERGGLLVLATVPLVWGTYGTSVKLLYQMGESPPGLLFNFACYAVSVMTFAAVASFNKAKGQRPASSGREEVEGKSGLPPEDKALLNSYAARAGAELGLWLFLGGTVQVWGLELTSASRAGFLVQLTTVIVPVLEAFLGRRKLKPQVWFACALATVGVALVSLGGVIPPGADVVKYIAGLLSAAWVAPSGAWEGILRGNLRGDLLVACSALFYSLHVVRLGVHVSKVDTLSLARAKAFSELSFAGLSLVVAGFLGGQGANFARFVGALSSKPDLLLGFVAVVVWNGALTSAYAMWAQTRGQAAVAPSEANLVYSLQPLWSVLFAVVLLKESFRPVEAAGAVLLLLSLYLVTTQSDGGAPGDGGEIAATDPDEDAAKLA